MKKVSISVSDLKKVMEALEAGEISMAEILALINKHKVKRKFDEVSLTVDYSRTLQEMIEAAKFDWANNQITENNFPLPAELKGKKVEISLKLFHFNRFINSEKAIDRMNKTGFRPARPAEILAFAEAYPEIQKEFPVVALGSIWRDGSGLRYVSVLHFDGDKRRLDLRWLVNDWHDHYRFLGVRK